jgi:hypothetical protein
MKSDLMTRKGRLAYANKIGGMLARRQTELLKIATVTLDRSYWNGGSYTWMFNVNEKGYSHKQLVTSKTMLAMFNSLTETPVATIHYMLIKLDSHRNAGV